MAGTKWLIGPLATRTLYTAETISIAVLVTGIDLSQPATSASRVINPSASTVKVGFVPSADGGQSPPATFYTASWTADTASPAYYASCLVGPTGGATTLAVGTYVPWLDFTFGSDHVQSPANDTLTVLA